MIQKLKDFINKVINAIKYAFKLQREITERANEISETITDIEEKLDIVWEEGTEYIEKLEKDFDDVVILLDSIKATFNAIWDKEKQISELEKVIAKNKLAIKYEPAALTQYFLKNFGEYKEFEEVKSDTIENSENQVV